MQEPARPDAADRRSPHRDADPASPENPRTRETSTRDGERTRDPAEQEELRRITGSPTMDSDPDDLAASDDPPRPGA